MIGMWNEFNQNYLMTFMIATTLFFAIPIFFSPLSWTKMMQWTIPEDTDLTVYFGRCLGSFVLIMEYFVYQAASTGAGEVWISQFMIGLFGFMVALHIYGAIKKIQPITETLEIGFWILLLFLSFAFYPNV